MSVAFTREEDLEATAADLPDRPISPHPNLVTASGLALIEAALASARAAYSAAQAHGSIEADRTAMARATRDLRYWSARRATAQLVETEPDGRVRFGGSVTVERADGRTPRRRPDEQTGRGRGRRRRPDRRDHRRRLTVNGCPGPSLAPPWGQQRPPTARTPPGAPPAPKKGNSMARKPNYSFERQERDRADAKKAAEKAAAKAEKKAAAAARKEAGLPPLED
jgi:hypothetical protein